MACPTVAKKLQLRRDTAAIWTLANPILSEGEIGIETDTNQVKIGNGAAHWNELPYFGGTSATGGIIDGGDPSSTYVGDPVIDFGGVV